MFLVVVAVCVLKSCVPANWYYQFGHFHRYVEKLEALGGIDLFFLGLGPEAGAASHLAYMKPGSGATYSDVAGLIPISESILEHHLRKFKAGGTVVTETD